MFCPFAYRAGRVRVSGRCWHTKNRQWEVNVVAGMFVNDVAVYCSDVTPQPDAFIFQWHCFIEYTQCQSARDEVITEYATPEHMNTFASLAYHI